MSIDGLTTVQSDFEPPETMDRLEAELGAHGMTVFARINHAALAQPAGMALRPTEVILFGNPHAGTPLMLARQTIGIDLPLKALVWQDEAGRNWLSFNEPRWLASRHEIAGAEGAVAAMAEALHDVAAKVTRNPRTTQAAGKPIEPKPKATETSNDAMRIRQDSDSPGSGSPGESELSLRAPFRGVSIFRLGMIGAVLAAVGGVFAYAGGWLTPHALTPKRIADAFEEVNGVHAGFRRNHAKGVCASGYFDSNGQGAALSQSSVFAPGRVPVMGRFSLSGGQPFAPDAPETVRGLGLRFQLPRGEEWRTAMVNLPVFPARTPQAFYDLLLASAPSPDTGKPDAQKMQVFLQNHPESAKVLELIRSQPKSSGFENSTFNSLNAFRFSNASGAVVWVRWSLVPGQPVAAIHPANPGAPDRNQLFDRLIADVHQHPLTWHLVVTVARPGDPTDNATIPWPPERQQIDVGTLTIDHLESDDTSPARDLNFDPLVLPNGIAPSDDPLLSARSAVYSQSFTRREGEPKQPSAVSPTAAQN